MLKKYLKSIIFFLFFITWYHGSISAQSVDYEALFGDDWQNAEAYERDNRYWMEPVLTENHIPYGLAIAVIFPELVRYSALRDKMEITLLKALYVNLGDEYADFSIGRLQMKPSFAWMIRDQWNDFPGRKSGISFRSKDEYDNIKNYRKSIINDLEDPRIQFGYLVAFIRICGKKYRTGRKDEVSRLKFISTAYNFGINKNKDEIESMIDKKFFNTKLIKSEMYPYSDVALFWYNKHKR